MTRSAVGLVIGALIIVYNLKECYRITDFLERMRNIRNYYETERVQIAIVRLGLILDIIMILVSVLMIIGNIKKRYKLIVPSLYYNVLIIVYAIAINVHSAIVFDGFVNMILIIYTAFLIFSWYPIYALYKDIRSEDIDKLIVS